MTGLAIGEAARFPDDPLVCRVADLGFPWRTPLDLLRRDASGVRPARRVDMGIPAGYDVPGSAAIPCSSEGKMPDLARRRREAALIPAQDDPAGDRVAVTPPARALFAPAGRFRLPSSRLGTTYITVTKYVWTGDSYHDPLLYAYVGSAWRHYSARHAALRSGSNEPLVYDGPGSTRQLINHTDQSVTDTYEYEAFGNLLGSTGGTANPYKYVGSLGYYQTGSSLMHLCARYYMPEVGRSLQADPIRESLAPTIYFYARQNPVTYVDPHGWLPVYFPPLPWGKVKDWIWDRCEHSALCQMLNPENWSNANDCKAQCYYDCLKGQQVRAGIVAGVGTGVGAIAREGLGPIGLLAGFSTGELLALHDCAAQCGYGEAWIP
ncbi:MAG: RHS repeat-associated core domain-containing protein [Armatimonadota bacterium]|nr:MAG: RHS repeat-associated core domain-containing protein [Armatimonadota bacterium]